MTEQHTATEVEGSFDLIPTALYRLETDAASAATLPTPMGDALLVFRSEADALAFRASSGKHPAAEGAPPRPGPGAARGRPRPSRALPRRHAPGMNGRGRLGPVHGRGVLRAARVL